MGTGVAELAMPGIVRVLLGFLVTAGLAVGVALAIRRFWPGVLARTVAGSRVRPLGHAAVSRTLTVHLVEVDGVKVVVAEGRTGVGLTLVPTSGEPSPTLPPPERSS